MKMFYMKSKLLTVSVLLMVSGQLFAAETAEPLVLQKIMRDMGENMQLIADHPPPPLSEKIRIMAFAGSNISQFKEHDGKTHNAARTLSETAARQDGYAVIADFATLQNSCLMCHQDFRESFKEYFYAKP